MEQYFTLLRAALSGEKSTNERTGAGTIGVFEQQARFDLKKGFPIVTTKPVYWKGVVEELLWFLRGETNIRPLLQKNVHIWSSDCLRFNLSTVVKSGLISQDEISHAQEAAKDGDYSIANDLIKSYERKILSDEDFANVNGDLGPVYGAQWRGTNGALAFDQIKNLESKLTENNGDRRMIVNAWNPDQIHIMALPPCHISFQVHVSPESNRLTLGWSQRSCDTVLGVPFNIASYGLLASLLAHTHNLGLGELVGRFADLHIYLPHLPAVNEQLAREPRKLPTLRIITKRSSVTEYTANDIQLLDYNPYPKLKNPTPMFGGLF